MIYVLDKLISDLDILSYTNDFLDVIQVQSPTKLGDPGIVTVSEYPYFFVQAVLDQPKSETMSRVGYDIRILTIRIGLVINQSDYFDPSVSEAPGERELIVATSKVRNLLRGLSKRKLDGLEGVQNVVVGPIGYLPDVRGDAFVRMAVTTLEVEKKYPHEV